MCHTLQMFAANNIDSHGGSAIRIQPFDVLGKPYILDGELEILYQNMRKKFAVYKNAFTA
jgi:hypothetical protein